MDEAESVNSLAEEMTSGTLEIKTLLSVRKNKKQLASASLPAEVLEQYDLEIPWSFANKRLIYLTVPEFSIW